MVVVGVCVGWCEKGYNLRDRQEGQRYVARDPSEGPCGSSLEDRLGKGRQKGLGCSTEMMIQLLLHLSVVMMVSLVDHWVVAVTLVEEG